MFKRLLIGRSELESRAQLKVALLRGQLGLLCFLVVLTYIIFDSLQGIYILVPAYSAVAAFSLLSIWLNRINKGLASSLTFLLLIGLMTYFFAVNDSSQSGVFVYFIMIALTSMVFFGYRYRLYVILFCTFLVFLFLSAYLFPLPAFMLSGEDMDKINAPEYREISFIINFLGGFFLCTAIVYFLMDLNFHSEKEILQKNVLLSKTNHELDRFVYSASHELRAPLTSLLGLLDIAGRTSNEEELKQCHSMMHERIQNMDLLIKEVIDFSRNARQEISKEKFLLRPLVQKILDDLKFMGPVDKMVLKLSINPDMEVITDPARLKMLLNNLISNAFKYADRQKDKCEIEIGAQVENQHVTLWVKDNGQGIAIEQQQKIFNMFYRASEDSSGSGLGLYIVREIVTRLNGTIHLESAPAVGSTFTLRLPNQL